MKDSVSKIPKILDETEEKKRTWPKVAHTVLKYMPNINFRNALNNRVSAAQACECAVRTCNGRAAHSGSRKFSKILSYFWQEPAETGQGRGEISRDNNLEKQVAIFFEDARPSLSAFTRVLPRRFSIGYFVLVRSYLDQVTVFLAVERAWHEAAVFRDNDRSIGQINFASAGE